MRQKRGGLGSRFGNLGKGWTIGTTCSKSVAEHVGCTYDVLFVASLLLVIYAISGYGCRKIMFEGSAVDSGGSAIDNGLDPEFVFLKVVDVGSCKFEYEEVPT